VSYSEFGRGYTVCLLMFVFHEPVLEDTRMIDLYRKEISETPEKGESRHVELWANGASDHLIELVTGGRVPKKSRERARAVAQAALLCGHGFTNRTWTVDEARGWIAEARSLLKEAGDPGTVEEAVKTDLALGLRPDVSGYVCAAPVPRFRWKNR
jgi:hypothetical protein